MRCERLQNNVCENANCKQQAFPAGVMFHWVKKKGCVVGCYSDWEIIRQSKTRFPTKEIQRNPLEASLAQMAAAAAFHKVCVAFCFKLARQPAVLELSIVHDQ